MSQTMYTRHQPGPVVFIIFGGAGDLTWRKLIPSLFNLHLNRSLPDKFAIIGVDRAALNDETLRKRLRDGVRDVACVSGIFEFLGIDVHHERFIFLPRHFPLLHPERA